MPKYYEILSEIHRCYEQGVSTEELEYFITKLQALLKESSENLERKAGIYFVMAELYARSSASAIENGVADSAFQYYQEAISVCSEVYSIFEAAKNNGHTLSEDELKKSNTLGIVDPIQAMAYIQKSLGDSLDQLLKGVSSVAIRGLR